MLGRAAAKFEIAFMALPSEARSAVALAMYRVGPALQQYQRDLQPIADSPELTEAIWDVLLAGAFALVKGGRGGIKPKYLDEMAARAPQTNEFLIQVAQALTAGMPGAPRRPALPPMPPAPVIGEK